MERSLFCSEEYLEDMRLRYYIVVEDIGGGYSDMESYGVRIEKINAYGGGSKSVETKQINNIFYKRNDIEEFMDLIIRNKVTPMSLRDIVEDYVVMKVTRAKMA